MNTLVPALFKVMATGFDTPPLKVSGNETLFKVGHFIRLNKSTFGVDRL